MVLSKEQVFAATRGAVRTELSDDGFHFFKCTERQYELWNNESPVLGYRALTTTGIRLDFVTDSDTVKIVVDKSYNDSISPPSSAKHEYELLVDGLLTGAALSEFENDRATLSAPLPAGSHRVTFVLPSHRIGVIREVTLSDGATFAPYHGERRRILFLGDSITQGWNSVKNVSSYAYRTAALLDADPLIFGIGGSYFLPSSVERMGEKFDAVFVAYGTNDFGRYASMRDFRDTVSRYFDNLCAAYPDTKRIAITPIYRTDDEKDREMGSFAELRRTVAEVAEAHGALVVDGYTLVPHDPYFYEDAHLHPNDLGFSFYAERLYAAVKGQFDA